MNGILGLLNNPWVIGIGGGILSGIIVAILSRAIFSRRDQREYRQKTALANNDVLYAIRPGISEGNMPTPETIRSLISATARKYGVDDSAMYNLEEISAELTKEIMDSSFISMTTKKEYCDSLTSLRTTEYIKESSTPDSDFQISNQYQTQFIFTISVLVAFLTAGSVIVLYVNRSQTLFEDPKQFILIALPAIIAISVSLMSVLYWNITRRSRVSKRDESNPDE